MKFTSLIAAFAVIGTVPIFGSTLYAVSDSEGTPYLVTAGDSTQKASQMAGMLVTGVFGNGDFSCVFQADGTCSSDGNFSLVVTPPTSNTISSEWTISNLRTAGAGSDLLSLSMEGVPGLTAFNPCVVDGHPDINDQGCQSITDGFGNGRSVSDSPGGTDNVTASVFYTDALALTSPNYDIWGTVVLSFGDDPNDPNDIPFGGGGSFVFFADTDQLLSADSASVPPAEIPEPSTAALLGLGLTALGLVRLRRRER